MPLFSMVDRQVCFAIFQPNISRNKTSENQQILFPFQKFSFAGKQQQPKWSKLPLKNEQKSKTKLKTFSIERKRQEKTRNKTI